MSGLRSFKASKPHKNAVATLFLEDHGLGEGQKIPGLPEKLAAPTELPSHLFSLPKYRGLVRLTEADADPGDAEATTAAYRSAMVNPALRLCEKSPPNLIRSRYLQALFPDATFVAIVRHPWTTVSANGKKRSKWAGVRKQTRHWIHGYKLFLKDNPYLKRCMTVKYEDLVHDAPATMTELCGFCELEFDPIMLEGIAIDDSIDAELIALLSDEEKRMIEQACERVAQRLGYAEKGAEVNH